MGLLNTILGALGSGQNKGNDLLGALGGILQNSGGLQGLLEKLNALGLGELVRGWMSSGQGIPKNPAEIAAAIGPEKLQQLAAETGVPLDQISGYLAQYLPQVADKLGPGGNLLSAAGEQGGISSLLKGGLEKFLGR